MLEVYQKRTFIEIDSNVRKLNVVFKENAWENEKKFFLHITLNRVLEPQRFQGPSFK